MRRGRLFIEILSDSNHILILQEMSIYIDSSQSFFFAWKGEDSIKAVEVNKDFLGLDTVVYSNVIVHRIGLINDGIYKEYYENGQIKLVGKYKRYFKTGTWRYYSNRGKLLKKEKWENGVIKRP